MVFRDCIRHVTLSHRLNWVENRIFIQKLPSHGCRLIRRCYTILHHMITNVIICHSWWNVSLFWFGLERFYSFFNGNHNISFREFWDWTCCSAILRFGIWRCHCLWWRWCRWWRWCVCPISFVANALWCYHSLKIFS